MGSSDIEGCKDIKQNDQGIQREDNSDLFNKYNIMSESEYKKGSKKLTSLSINVSKVNSVSTEETNQSHGNKLNNSSSKIDNKSSGRRCFKAKVISLSKSYLVSQAVQHNNIEVNNIISLEQSSQSHNYSFLQNLEL